MRGRAGNRTGYVPIQWFEINAEEGIGEMDWLFDPLTSWSRFRECAQAAALPGIRGRLIGLSGSGRAHFAYSLMRGRGERFVYLAPNDYAARLAFEEFSFYLPDQVVLVEPAEYMLYDVDARSSDVGFRRMAALQKLLEKDWFAAVFSVTALMQWMPDPEKLAGSFLTISAGDQIDPLDLAARLAEIGYERAAQVSGKGQFARRGDILDIFPSTLETPVRIEFFDNEVDSLRSFDSLTQRTLETISSVTILPDRETDIRDADIRRQAESAVRASLERVAGQLRQEGRGERAEQYRRRVESDLQQLCAGRRFPGFDRYLPFLTGKQYTLLDYTGSTVVFLEEPDQIRGTVQAVLEDHLRVCDTLSETSGLLPETYQLYLDTVELDTLLDGLEAAQISLTEFGTAEWKHNTFRQFTAEIPFREVPSFSGNTRQLLDQIRQWQADQYTVVLFTGTESKEKRLRELLEEEGLLPLPPGSAGTLQLLPGGVHGGFVYPACRFAVVSDHALLKRESRAIRSKLKGKPLTSFADLQPGDLIVHEIHGIGRFECVESMTMEGIQRDYIKILYKDNGVLYVPMHQLSSVQKYIGPENGAPKLNKLGGSEWERTTAKVKDSLRQYAQELVELYARRQNMQGFAYPADTVWQKEFEDQFAYEETEDQLKCIDEIKADMELPRPMERLLCGDVGYGKTEVALRAAFKAVCHGKQVAFLVPTTVLAQQHYLNFVERFREFPVKIDYLCRFRTAAEKKEILRDVQKGTIDILIGTHSLLQSKLQFRDLGLVVVDEEQRFGVMHKEKLKLQYPQVDILTLSATPIPRTLHMSLSGIRDISLIEDPPGNRQPVQTYVTEWTPDLIRNAIYRELGRKGQVFYLYNKVRTILEKKRQLEAIVPEVRIGVAHGQMSERELEDVMAAFVRQDFDVLLCTTIIESGLDLPNANTIIMEDGDHLGLAQLYQIRGRVGRSNRLAYAYITYQKDKELTETAEKRLRTIREFTEFGAGFKIALRDLELRGAGSVLGERQHGQLATVGYDMYCKLLSEVVQETQGKTAAPRVLANVEFRVNAYLEEEYIGDEESRLDLYQRISRIQEEEEILELTDELIDRFGVVPENVSNLMRISQIRYLAEQCGFASVIQKEHAVLFLLRPGISLAEMMQMAGVRIDGSPYKQRITLSVGSEPYLSLQMDCSDSGRMLQDVAAFLQENFYLSNK